jgi:hypothetical protein
MMVIETAVVDCENGEIVYRDFGSPYGRYVLRWSSYHKRWQIAVSFRGGIQTYDHPPSWIEVA